MEDQEIKRLVKDCVRSHGLRRTHVSFVDGEKLPMEGVECQLARLDERKRASGLARAALPFAYTVVCGT